ncbi:DUF6166 domain-containing protein [Koleobacter methoxysyntrophicus]|uniref:DUF6166 domain-containing protein n=1 Tax=Koleobacter methoxysyntrophicus TaxID=2751313 RepID=UPI003BAF36B9
MWRDKNGRACVNIPHSIIYHSPCGFEWGYGGSGPADLALNILYAVIGDKDLAFNLHQKFKWEFTAQIPWEGGVVKRPDVLKWIAENSPKKPV